MPALRTNRSQFRFSATAVVRVNTSTHIDFKMPSPPWRALGVQPTITNVFRSGEDIPRRRTISKAMQGIGYVPEQDSSETIDDTQENTADGDGDGTQPPAISASAQVEGGGTESLALLPKVNTSRKGKGRQTPARFPSVISVVSTGEPSASTSFVPHVPAAGTANPTGAPVWTRFGASNGEPLFIKEQWRSSTTDKNCLTSCWECYSQAPLNAPPDLTGQNDLAVGDIFCDRISGVETPKMWIWTTVNGKLVWKPIFEGETREDGRRLTITPAQKRPSWVKSDWAVKRMVRAQRSRRA